jgi:LysR family transcriptional regulator, mexEF-oprN operon transcriptional activator
MSRPNLLNIDLNLLVAFEALVTEGHVSRAAAQIGVSQPAMSRSLKQLRGIFGDTLFCRTKEGMMPTPMAIELARQIHPGLEMINNALRQKAEFVPAEARRRFFIATTDMATYLALPLILRRLRKEAPYIEIVVLNTSNSEAVSKADSGQADFAIGTYDYLPPTFDSINLRSLREVCVADPNHPLITGDTISLEQFLSLPHVVVRVPGDHGMPIDIVLETHGYKRPIVLTVPHFLAVPELVLGTDAIAVVVEDLLNVLPAGRELARFEVPVPLEPVMGRMAWHRRSQDDPGHRWCRELIRDAVLEREGVTLGSVPA